MARSRSIPVSLLKEPDFFELSAEARVVFIGLVLEADDEGRGRAHPGLLARLFNVSEAAVQEAFSQLVERGLLLHYQVGRQQYYQWLPWKQWQSLSKPTPSQLPPPPAWEEQEPVAEPVLAESAGCSGSGVSWKIQGNPGFPWKPQLEEEGEEEGEEEREKEEEHEREKEEGKMPAAAEPGPKIVPFPASSSSSPPRVDVDAGGCSLSLSNNAGPQQEIAEILGLPLSRPLGLVLEEFSAMGWPALRGEAIECAEYIRDPRRNQKRRRMTPGFFRRWLKRFASVSERSSTGDDRTRAGSIGPSRRGRERVPEPEPAWGDTDPTEQYRAYVEEQRKRWLAACQAAEAAEATDTTEPAAAVAAGGS
jgi:hypothetical protein